MLWHLYISYMRGVNSLFTVQQSTCHSVQVGSGLQTVSNLGSSSPTEPQVCQYMSQPCQLSQSCTLPSASLQQALDPSHALYRQLKAPQHGAPPIGYAH